MKKDAQIETQEYNAENVLTKKKLVTVESVNRNTSKLRTVTTEKGVVTEDNLQTYNYENGEVKMISETIDSKTKKPALLIYPADMQPGQKIDNDVTFVQTGKTPDGKKATVSIKISDRKIIEKDKVTVKGGTWDCTKISYKFSLGIKVAFIKIPFDVDAVEWYNTEVGVVKTEYSMKGKQVGYSEIVSVR